MRFVRHSGSEKTERGSALIELSVSMMIYMLVMLGIMDVSRALWRLHELTQLAREGARIASIIPTIGMPEGQTAVMERLQKIIDFFDQNPTMKKNTVNVVITPTDQDGDGAQDYVDVEVSQLYGDAYGVSIIPGLSGLNLRATISMPVFSIN